MLIVSSPQTSPLGALGSSVFIAIKHAADVAERSRGPFLIHVLIWVLR